MSQVNYFYLTVKDSFTMYDVGNSSSSERTIDIPFNTLAKNEAVLSLLNLVSDYCDQSNSVEWFAAYLSSFTSNMEKSEAINKKLLTNPMIRILVMSPELLQQLKEIYTPVVTE